MRRHLSGGSVSCYLAGRTSEGTAVPRPTAILVLGLASLTAACASKGPAFEPRSAEVAAVVEITNGFSFAPETVVVPAGGTVEWRNSSLMTHTVTADPAHVKKPEEVSVPAGAQPFDSGELGRGQVFRHTFTVPGTYHYICQPHDWLSMAGVVDVRP